MSTPTRWEEIWHEAEEWLKGDRFDAVMNYVLSRAAYGYFGAETVRRDYRPGGYAIERLDTPAFAAAIERMLERYDWQVVTAQLNLLSSHDTARNLWALDGDAGGVRLCLLLQMDAARGAMHLLRRRDRHERRP